MSSIQAGTTSVEGGHRAHAPAFPRADFRDVARPNFDTLYEDEGFQVANALDRFAIGDRDDLPFGDDGSLEILIQHEQPESGTSISLPAVRPA